MLFLHKNRNGRHNEKGYDYDRVGDKVCREYKKRGEKEEKGEKVKSTFGYAQRLIYPYIFEERKHREDDDVEIGYRWHEHNNSKAYKVS